MSSDTLASPPDCTDAALHAGFACRRCGACCRGPGDVVLEAGEPERIAALLGDALYAFTARYTRLLDDRRGLSLTERPDGACIFLQDDNGCRIQDAKPQQCRGFPHAWRSARLMATCAGLRGGSPPHIQEQNHR